MRTGITEKFVQYSIDVDDKGSEEFFVWVAEGIDTPGQFDVWTEFTGEYRTKFQATVEVNDRIFNPPSLYASPRAVAKVFADDINRGVKGLRSKDGT